MTGSSGFLYEGKAKRIHAGASSDRVDLEFKDEATAFNAAKRAHLEGKGWLNCQISARLFDHLERSGIPTHYLGLSPRGAHWMTARRVRVVPIEVVIRNRAAGSLCRELPIDPGTPLDPPLLDLYYKDDGLGDPLLTESRLTLLDLVTPERRQEIERMARQVNAALQALLVPLDLDLIDFKLEFGETEAGTLVVADEISPDTCRLWDQRDRAGDDPQRSLDKDRFRRDLGGVIEAYREVYKRVQGACPDPCVCR
ncbi:phosphoribosylaminoimidazolesuccinocarboxamide synthase [Synechococcus sp. RSCCF101]|uniref:phosphoribosylaminoimidazolesuccinocarboxamide synthase n=1 Tax=Synechococcus sp. RSCCF101 TaxID=2511069 RepID=UPI001245756F|nr:phosphoribosylaminoimidazolesuccinocarboxamide synthase [Synechococcus sp. RSCCF101]QEY33173.1 phosphoribosylaminoimidazolesuccinocarboxamide synthase [Synechococcus sp. RSCCF101]